MPVTLTTGDARRTPYRNLRAQLIYCDPPSNKGLNEGSSSDRLTEIEYQQFAITWLKSMLHNAARDCWIVFTLQYKLRRLYEHLIHINIPGLLFVQECIWHYEFGLYTNMRFVPAHDSILIYKYGTPPFYWQQVAIESQRQRVGDLRADARGRTPGTVWDIPRVPGNSTQRNWLKDKCRTSQPFALCERILLAFTKKGEIIYDPFAGSGTMAEAARNNGRTYFGIDICSYYVKEALARLKEKPIKDFMELK